MLTDGVSFLSGNGGSPDEISVLNGADDNHKVWPGKTPEPGAAGGGGAAGNESHYDYGSTLRSFRSSASGLSHRNRPRQMMMPSSPPPPPIPEELQQSAKSSADERDGEGKKEKRKKRRSKSRDNVDGGGEAGFVMNGDAVPRMRNGSLSGPPPHFRPVNGHGPMPPPGMRPGMMPPMPPPHLMMGPHGPMMMAPPGPPQPPPDYKGSKKHGTFSGRNSKKRGMPPPFMMFPPHGPPPPPHMMPPPHLMPPPGHPLYQQVKSWTRSRS